MVWLKNAVIVRGSRLALLISLCLLVSSKGYCSSQNNDHIFPAAAAAKSSIDFDSRGFLIDGNRTFIVSAGMEYARVPRAMWRDRLLRLKRAGFNTVEIYTFWNYHEPREGQFDFTGNHDLDAFLKLVKQMGMYAIVRVGPYYCAEWNSGGYPVWLRFKPGVMLRQPNQPFETYVDRFFDRLIPIVAANQINHGGSVILVQLENEHPLGWGTLIANSYFAHLRDKAVSLGIQVPYFFSGLHHSNDPAGEASSLDNPTRPNPWMSTEFYAAWYDHYGPQPSDAEVFGRRAWKIIAHGGNGYNVYMGYGGTNFGYTNNNEDSASYDYGAAVGQAGDLRPVYYSFKRAAWFARSFQNVLEDSVDATTGLPASADNAQVKLTARHSPSGNILFLDNPTKSVQQTRIRFTGNGSAQSASLTLAPGEIMPIVYQASLAPGVTIGWAPSRILGIARQGATTTLVIYGPVGGSATLDFATQDHTSIIRGAGAMRKTRRGIRLHATYASGEPAEYIFAAGSERIRILAMNEAEADRTWFVKSGVLTYVVSDPEYAGELRNEGGHLQLTTERPWVESHAPAEVDVYGAADTPQRLKGNSGDTTQIKSLPLAAWKTATASQPAAPDFDDGAWKESANPEQMGADGDLTADVWYRTHVDVTAPGTYTLHVANGGDRATAFVDGKRQGDASQSGVEFPLELTPGRHTIAIFVASDGRDKLYNYLGPIATKDRKGLDGPVTLRLRSSGRESAIPIAGWRMRGGPGLIDASTQWQPLPADAAFSGPEYFRTTFAAPAYGAAGSHPIWRVMADGLGHGSVWVNGHNLGRYPEKIPVHGLYIPECWLKTSNTLTIFDEDGHNPARVKVEVEPAASRYVSEYVGP